MQQQCVCACALTHCSKREGWLPRSPTFKKHAKSIQPPEGRSSTIECNFPRCKHGTTYVAIDPRHRMVRIERCTPHGTTLLWRLCGLKIWIWSNEKASRKGASIDPMMACQERIYMLSLVFDRARCDMKCWWCLNYNRHSRRSSRKIKSRLYSLIGVACISNVALNPLFIRPPSLFLAFSPFPLSSNPSPRALQSVSSATTRGRIRHRPGHHRCKRYRAVEPARTFPMQTWVSPTGTSNRVSAAPDD